MPKSSCVITNKELKQEENKLTPYTGEINLVMLGCPHYTYEQLLEIERLFNGRKCHPDVAFWVLADAAAKELAERSHLYTKLENLGVHIVGNTCIDEPCWKSFEGHLGITDSPKCAYYRKGTGKGQPFVIRRLSECVEAAIKGRVD